MALEFMVTLEDQPGTLARLCGILGDAGINIEAICGGSADAKGLVRFVPRDAEKAADALNVTHLAYTTREVLIVRVLDEPGMLGDVARVMAHARINIDAVYLTTRGHVVLGVDDIDGAIQVAGGMAVLTFD